jgi:medium-chain acyl-[acyl-carrier-protein] hydrolase
MSKRFGDDWWIEMGHAEASLTLCCFPYAGGGPFLFLPWQARLGKRWNVVALSLPARGPRISEPPVSDLQTIVDKASAGLDQIDGPWFAFGHSMGAMICFELARQRRHQGKRLPEALFVSGARAPDMLQREALRFDLPDQEFVAVLRDLEGTPPELLADDQ